jgi:hypothetical protein
MPLPQTETQMVGEPEHIQPLSSVHVAEQPSFAAMLPSSQVSAPVRMPLPQTDEQTLGMPEQM